MWYNVLMDKKIGEKKNSKQKRERKNSRRFIVRTALLIGLAGGLILIITGGVILYGFRQELGSRSDEEIENAKVELLEKYEAKQKEAEEEREKNSFSEKYPTINFQHFCA